ncbi:PREDICTED: uncharacterized protein LOC109339965 [Lupinus angustifolius]|uniref:uncharacterized protein LOC109339965 n=1 Tax=Lupinus angustifolius TaxID=3871 RepID=UPI00092F0F44|nr:PREDICTED: uncharacterized protein LOC109339965 [Lupinus angustifolius]
MILKPYNAERIEDYRPIALANFQSKIITKVLADKLASIVAGDVSPNQRGFVKDKNIKDYICIASEAINLLEHKTFGGNLAIKLDITKAFDTIDWGFLLDTIKAFGFSETFIKWISTFLQSFLLMSIAKIRVFSAVVVVLGRVILYFPSFSVCLKMGFKKELDCLKKLLQVYVDASGQNINPTKCEFYIAKATPRKIATISSALGFLPDSLPFHYLGVPLFKGKPKKVHLQPVGDKIIQKLARWKGLTLSIMGRVELVKSVIQTIWAIPNWLAQGFPHIALQISSTITSLKDDKLIWQNSNDGVLGLKDAYRCITPANNPINWCKTIWSVSIPPSKSFTTWRLIKGKMPTDDNLQKRGCSLVYKCNLCKKSMESSQHIFQLCPFAASLWQWIGSLFSITIDINSLSTIMLACNNSFSPQLRQLVATFIVHTTNTIWYCRKQDRFQDNKISMQRAIIRIKASITLSGNSSLATAKTSLHELAILKSLNIKINYKPALKITEVR